MKTFRVLVGLAVVLAAAGCEDMAKPPAKPPQAEPVADRSPKKWTVQVGELADWPGARATVDGRERAGGDAIADATAFAHRPGVGPVDGDVVTLRFTSAWSTSRPYGARFSTPGGWGVGKYIGPGTWTATVEGADWESARTTISGAEWTGGEAVAMAVVYDNRPDHGPVVGDVVTLRGPSWSLSVMYTSRGW